MKEEEKYLFETKNFWKKLVKSEYSHMLEDKKTLQILSDSKFMTLLKELKGKISEEVASCLCESAYKFKDKTVVAKIAETIMNYKDYKYNGTNVFGRVVCYMGKIVHQLKEKDLILKICETIKCYKGGAEEVAHLLWSSTYDLENKNNISKICGMLSHDETLCVVQTRKNHIAGDITYYLCRILPELLTHENVFFDIVKTIKLYEDDNAAKLVAYILYKTVKYSKPKKDLNFVSKVCELLSDEELRGGLENIVKDMTNTSWYHM